MGKVKFVLETEEAKAVRGFMALNAEQRKIELQNKKIEMQSKRTSGSAIKSSASWVGGLIGITSAYGAVSKAIGLVVDGLKSVNAERKKSAELAKQNESTSGQLAQLAMGDKKLLRRMLRDSRKSSLETGMTYDEGKQLQFALESNEMQGSRKFFAGFHGITDTKTLVEGVKKYQEAFGKKDAGTPEAITNKLLAASATTNTTIDQLASALPKMASLAKMVGGDDSDSLATMAVISKQMGADEAATRLQAFSSSLVGSEYEGMNLIEAASAIDKKGMSNKKLKKMLGNVRSLQGFKILADNMDSLKSTRESINEAERTTGKNDSIAMRTQNTIFVDPAERAARLAKISERRSEFSKVDNLAIQPLIAEMIRNEFEAKSIAKGENSFKRWAKLQAFDVASFGDGVYGPDQAHYVRQTLRATEANGGDQQLVSMLKMLLEGINENTGALKQNLELGNRKER